MTDKQPIDLGHDVFLIDGYDLGLAGRTGTYVLREPELTIVETSASPSVPYILTGLRNLGLRPEAIRYIIVTHIHLDHAGGVGLLLQECPDAQVIVHPKGARHLANPERLIQGAKAVYKEKFDRLFNPILPVAEDRIVVKADRETLTIGPNRTLEFFDTPGHANHHFSIYDPKSSGMFTGDTFGIRYHQVEDAGVTFYLPSTSPNQFIPEAMERSIELIKGLQVGRIYFGHYGMTTDVDDAYRQIKHWLPVFVETAKQLAAQGKGEDEIASVLLSRVRDHLTSRNVPQDHQVYQVLQIDLEVCAMGLVDYLSKQVK
ncbi:MBL fold metallo-hydrolase [Brevibacillus massiliensis]|uniref:MBL fold metallo-hydrolase n=1 Tax=Brevibacillus massiliensis TaxID=1118054 RepID=UPI00031FFF37|nr:MBL fold metallo-hydrolase [Brevibacillus massiliensis]